jgi:hypothetical protein
MPAKDYAQTLKGLTVGLVVRDIGKAIQFQQEVLKTRVVYSDVDFAVLQGYGGEWMLHADHTYQEHPLENVFAKATQRGAGIELRLHGCDPDAAAAAALRLGFKVLAGPEDKKHDLREAHLVDADGYVWVPDVPTKNHVTKDK